jgi:lipoprotein-anchoring transpeptidase ErfK/SrfK
VSPTPLPAATTATPLPRLAMPLPGLTAAQLRDTFNETRGGERPHEALDIAGTELRVPNLADVAPPAAAASIVVDKSESTVELLDAEGKTLAQYPASTGSEHDPLPAGEWKITGVSLDPAFHYNPELFWDADPAHAKARIAPGPNNPVGVAWIDLSKPHYGIHGTPEPATVGKSQTHGCIRVTNWSAREIAQSVKAGMPAVLQE